MKFFNCHREFDLIDGGSKCEICHKAYCPECRTSKRINLVEAGQMHVVICEHCNTAEVKFEEIKETYRIFKQKLWNWRRREVFDEMVITPEDVKEMVEISDHMLLHQIYINLTIKE